MSRKQMPMTGQCRELVGVLVWLAVLGFRRDDVERLVNAAERVARKRGSRAIGAVHLREVIRLRAVGRGGPTAVASVRGPGAEASSPAPGTDTKLGEVKSVVA